MIGFHQINMEFVNEFPKKYFSIGKIKGFFKGLSINIIKAGLSINLMKNGKSINNIKEGISVGFVKKNLSVNIIKEGKN